MKVSGTIREIDVKKAHSFSLHQLEIYVYIELIGHESNELLIHKPLNEAGDLINELFSICNVNCLSELKGKQVTFAMTKTVDVMINHIPIAKWQNT